MRITFLSPPPNMGGGIKVIAIYASYLARHGHEVRVVSHAYPPRSMWSQAKHHLKTLFKQRLNHAPQPSYYKQLEVVHTALDTSGPITDVHLPDADIVIATWWETAEWMHDLSVAKGRKVYFVQGHEVFDVANKARVEATYRTDTPKIVISQWLMDLMHAQYDAQHLYLVPNAFNRTDFYFEPRGKQGVPTLGFLAVNPDVKGTDLAITVAARLRQRYPGLRIRCFGGYPLKSQLTEQFATLGAEFDLAPPVTRIREIYAGCDVWLSASRSEGFNLTAMEAMACGTPIVATCTGWPAHTIESGINGVLTKIEDVNSLYEGTCSVLNQNDAQWRKMSAQARATVEDASWEQSGALFERALLEIVQK